MQRVILILAVLGGVLLPVVNNAAWPDDDGYEKEVVVRAATRLDWVFAVANQSIEPPRDWLEGYDSTKQRYELFLPHGDNKSHVSRSRASKTGASAKTPATASAKKTTTRDTARPLVLFISAGDQPAGWSQWQTVCREQGIAFASPFGAGNNTPMPRRIRVVLDVLDDVRRRHPIDADRTYIAGFSGGGRVACAIAFALPELFGGVIPVCAAGDLRDEPWLKHRVIDRLSVAPITGTGDFNRGEVELFRGAMLNGVGVRTKVTVVEKLGHGIPDSKTFAEVLEWLDAGAANRNTFAQTYAASRLEPKDAPTREQSSKALFDEGQSRLKNPKTLYSGLMQLQGVMQRWPNFEVANDAKRILLEYEAKTEHPWEADDIAEQRRFLVARARGLSAYAMSELPTQYAKQKPEMLEAAANLWILVLQDGQDEKAVEEAKQQLPKLKQQLAGETDK